MFKETAQETYDFLKPSYPKHKTNQKYEISKKVILQYVFENSYNLYLNYRKHQDILGLDNVFSLLDGKGFTKFPGDSVTIIKQSVSEKKDYCETNYFKYKWYANGNLHVEFKRLDLLDKLNKLCGGSNIKGEQ